jgi:hypothetical protein
MNTSAPWQTELQINTYRGKKGLVLCEQEKDLKIEAVTPRQLVIRYMHFEGTKIL